MEKALALTAEEGSRQLIYGALAEDKDGQMRGAYITAANVAEPSDFVISEVGEKVQERLWVRCSPFLVQYFGSALIFLNSMS